MEGPETSVSKEWARKGLHDPSQDASTSVTSDLASSLASGSTSASQTTSHLNGPDSDSESESDGQSTSKGSVANLSTVSSITDRNGFTGGFQYSGDKDFDIPTKKLRKRELKWIAMNKSWDKFITRHYEKVRERCRKGIPPSMRSLAWFHLCNGHTLKKRNPHLYDHLVQQPGDEKIVDEIQRDIHRQFPTHEMFAEQGGSGQSELFNVLKAYSTFNKRDGYCQAHAPLAATLLMQMPSEQAFFCLASLCNDYLPLYFAPDLQMLQVDANLLMSLLRKAEPAVYKHLKKQGITPILFMTDWFMCIYTRNLPWETVLRIWDMFFCEGRKVLFRVGLTILRLVLGPASVRKECPTMHETVTRLRNIPTHLVETKFFFSEMSKLKLSEEELSIGFQRHWAEYEARKVETARQEAARASTRSNSGSRRQENHAEAASSEGATSAGARQNNNYVDKSRKGSLDKRFRANR